MKSTRREWLRRAGSAAAVPGYVKAQSRGGAQPSSTRPNILLIISDQFRADAIGAMGSNPMGLTPNLDRMARRGVFFRNAISNQPVCAPARASILTGQYPARHGVWRNGIGLPPDATTLASELRKAGYTANYIGKWHLAQHEAGNRDALGPVGPRGRGGFLDLWEASNVLELTSHPYEGDLFDAGNKPIHFSGVYRSDFMTERAQQFLKTARAPFFLVLSYLEVHHQNDLDAFVPPKEYAGRYKNPFIPHDLRPFPGSWPSQIADYFACVAKMDETVGTLLRSLEEYGHDKNTIVAFTSDHGCHFKTRAPEYKRTPHDSSIRIPLVMQGPGFDGGVAVSQLVSQVDFAPTLLEAAGLTPPQSMQGRSFRRLREREDSEWRNEVYFEMSEWMIGRGIRTPQYTYAAAVPRRSGWKPAPSSDSYTEYMMYDNYADPYQLVNMAGRAQVKNIAEELRTRLLERIMEAGDNRPAIEPMPFPYA